MLYTSIYITLIKVVITIYLFILYAKAMSCEEFLFFFKGSKQVRYLCF